MDALSSSQGVSVYHKALSEIEVIEPTSVTSGQMCVHAQLR